VDAGDAQILQHHCAEIRFRHALRPALEGAFRRRHLAPECVVARGHDAMRRKAFDREGAGHADLRLVLVRTVVEQLDISGLRDGRVDLLLPGDANERWME
jgi:hypothetical protein